MQVKLQIKLVGFKGLKAFEVTVPLQEKGSALLNEIRKHCPEGSLNLVVAGRHLDLDKTLEAQEIKEGQKVVVTKQTRDEETPDPNVIKRPHHSQLKVDPKFDGLNAGSVDALQQLGIADNKIIDVLRQLRNKPNYTSLGEVEKALDILEAEQKQALEQERQAIIASQQQENNDFEMALEHSKEQAQKMVRRQSEKRQQEQITTEQNVALSSPGLSLLYAWGDNTMGKLGIGDAAALKVPRPQLIAGIETNVTQVSCGADHTLILTKIGTVYQMGQYFLSTKKGEALKHGTLHKPKIVELPQHIHAMQVAAGGGHSIALMENHEVYTWGNNLHGSLGVGLSTQMCSNQPRLVASKGGYKLIAAGQAHTCAITRSDRLMVWGTNRACQLGYAQNLQIIYQPVLFGGQIEARSCSDQLAQQNIKFVQDTHLAPGLKYLHVECSSYLTVVQINMEPFLLITGNNQPHAWACREIIKQPPKLFKCVGSAVYVKTHDDVIYKINSTSRQYTRVEAESFESAGFDFTLTVKDSNVFSRGKNQYGQLGLGHFDETQTESFVPGISFPIEKVAVGSCSCFAIIQNRSCFHRYLKEFLDVNQSEEQKEDLGFALQCTNDKFVTVHSAIAAIYQLPGCIPCSREVVILGLRLLYGELTDRNIVQWVRDQAQDEWKFSQQLNELGRLWIKNETIQQYVQLIKARMAFIGKENESIERERHQDGEAERADLFRRCRDKTGKITYPEHPTMNQHQEPNRGDPDEDIQDNENDSDDHDMFF